MLAIPVTKTVAFCAFVKKQTQCREQESFNKLLLIDFICNCA